MGENNMIYEAVIGLEVHAQLLTESKIFCGCSTTFGANPNYQTCPVCLGMPGVLPVLNQRAVEFAIKMGLATSCTIARHSKFARKNYFYPDLPKGYQISQFELPICENGKIEITLGDDSKRNIGITRIHLEEDAGKSIHDETIAGTESLVDVNRCGVPLLEIVSEPDLRTPQEAYIYLSTIKQILSYLEICDGNMEEGSLRCDANISLKPVGRKEFGTKTEMKNMNSFRNVERALTFEIQRQQELLMHGEKIIQETLLWDADAGVARTMRGKEEAHDYRYFPEPDLVPLVLSEEQIDTIKQQLPELPGQKKERFITQYHLPPEDVEILISTKELASYYEELTQTCPDHKMASNWVLSDILRVLKETKAEITTFIISPARLGQLLNLIVNKTISHTAAKTVFEELLVSTKDAHTIVQEKGLAQVSDLAKIEPIIDKIYQESPKQVEQYKQGKTQVLSYFIGQTMKATKGKANPGLVSELWKKKLET
jgi:aspartyl-tRNA(Asn)/glutamyl-tRNA(Gln) amidotransferase subunit B